MKIYISGKITGCELDLARAKFNQAAKRLTYLGHTPVNPFDNGLPDTADWAEHIVRDIEMMLGCEAIFLLDDWKDSRGARIEHKIAVEYGLRIIPQSDFMIFPSGNFIFNNSKYDNT